MELLTERSARIVAARKLTRRTGRDAAGLFLAEGRQAVVEALAEPSGVREVFATEAALDAHRELLAAADVPVRLITDKAAAGLSETVTPQGLVAVCALRDVPVETLTAAPPRLAVALAELADPGNAGTILRTADACGAGAVVFGAGSADPYGGKAVRASAGSVFHVDVVRGAPLEKVIPALQAAGVTVLAADGGGEAVLDEADDPARRPGALAVRQRGARGAGRPCRPGRCPGPHPDARPRGEPQPRRGRGDLPLHHPARPGLRAAVSRARARRR